MAEDIKKLVSLQNLADFKTLEDAKIAADIAVETSRAQGVEGTLSNLTTDAKTNLVAAINEIDSHADANTSAIGVEPAEGVTGSGLKKRVKDLEDAVGSGGSVDTKIKNAIEALDSEKSSAEVEAGKGLQVTVKEVDGKIDSVTLTGNYDSKYDALNAASTVKTEVIGTATDAKTADTIYGAKAFATDAVTTLANGAVASNTSAIEAINNTTTGILATAKGYTDTEVKKVTDSIGTVPADTTVMAEIGKVSTAVGTEKSRAEGVEGTLTSLTTDAKTNLVAAINEVDAHADSTQSDLDTLEAAVGDMSAVKTTAKTVAGAVDELKDAVDTAKSAGEVYLDTAATPTEGYLKTYVISQGKDAEGSKIEIGKIDIPKDLVVTAGEVVKNPDGQPAGTYIKLTIANQTNPIYINVKDLVDIYTAAQGATQVQVAISDTNVVSATLVAGGVGTTELADASVTTAKIADKNVTKDKLADGVQSSLDLADSALQASDIATGSANGTISVEGTDVAVKGLGSAAYTESTAYEAAGSIATEIAKLDATVTQDYTNTNPVTVSATETDGKLTAISASVRIAESSDITALFETKTTV